MLMSYMKMAMAAAARKDKNNMRLYEPKLSIPHRQHFLHLRQPYILSASLRIRYNLEFAKRSATVLKFARNAQDMLESSQAVCSAQMSQASPYRRRELGRSGLVDPPPAAMAEKANLANRSCQIVASNNATEDRSAE